MLNLLKRVRKMTGYNEKEKSDFKMGKAINTTFFLI